jgi:hypothetical protein
VKTSRAGNTVGDLFQGVWAAAAPEARVCLLQELDSDPVQVGIHQNAAIASRVLFQAAVLKAPSPGAVYQFAYQCKPLNQQATERAMNHSDQYSPCAMRESGWRFAARCGYTVAKAACPQLWLKAPPWSEVRLPQRLRFTDARRSSIADFALARYSPRAPKSHGCI